MKKILFLFLSFCAFANAAITLKTVVFNDQEQNASTYLITYYPYQDFINLGFTATQAGYVMTCRNSLNPTLTCVSNAGLTTATLMRIREQSYLIDWSLVTNSLGINQRDFNSIMALMGALFGFSFVFFLIYIVVDLARGRNY
jgi:hypothetical protein